MRAKVTELEFVSLSSSCTINDCSEFSLLFRSKSEALDAAINLLQGNPENFLDLSEPNPFTPVVEHHRQGIESEFTPEAPDEYISVEYRLDYSRVSVTGSMDAPHIDISAPIQFRVIKHTPIKEYLAKDGKTFIHSDTKVKVLSDWEDARGDLSVIRASGSVWFRKQELRVFDGWEE